jgi:hypothetical protein
MWSTSETYPTFDSVGAQPRGINVVVERPPVEMKPPWPVLISIHGGPADQALRISDPPVAAFRRAGRDVGALLDWIGTQSDFDASRVCVSGGSYGGYMALASLVHYSGRAPMRHRSVWNFRSGRFCDGERTRPLPRNPASGIRRQTRLGDMSVLR